MRLTQRLLLGSLLVVSALVVFVVAAVDRRLHTRITEETEQQLAREARLVSTQWTPGARPDALADAAGNALGHRVTLIDTSGHVLGDSQFDSVGMSRLQNHRTRPEVVAALGGRVGTARRVSASAGDEELYVAIRAPQGVARVALGTRSVELIFDRLRRDVYGAGAIALVGAMLLAWAFSRTVSRPIVQLRDVAQALAAGDLTRRPTLSAPGEVGDLETALFRLGEQLGARLHALEAEESLLVNLLDSLNEGVLAVDGARQVVRINAAARQILHVRGATPFAAADLPDAPVLEQALDAALGGRATAPAELSLDGRTLAVTTRPLADGGAVVAVLDLTATRRLEQVRRDFVANVSHELRTPLTVISGFAETLADEDGDIPEASRKRFTENIRANAARMQRIVDDLLDLSRIESGGWMPNPTRIAVADVAADAVTGAQAAATAKGLALRLEVGPNAEQIVADTTALHQVFSNLVENALRHTAAGSVTVFAQREAGGVRVGVRDTGSGIPPEHLPRIFERFYRADAGRSREAGGTGLGLAIVRHLVEAHGGSVRAESIPGRGTTVSALFPDEPVVAA